MLSYDPVSSLQHYPVTGGMKRFGLNPYGEPRYRIVFAPSRRYLVVGEWPDGSVCAAWVPKYKGLISETLTDGRPNVHSNVWIMERWIPAEEYHRPGKADWDLNCQSLGPWPERGEYELCYVFFPGAPSEVSIEYRIKLIEASRNVPFSETLAWHKNDAQKERQNVREQAKDMIRNRLPAYGHESFVGGHVHRSSKTAPIIRTAEELGLPTTPGMRTGKKAARLLRQAA